MHFGQTFHSALSSGHPPSRIHHCGVVMFPALCHHGEAASLGTEFRKPQVEVMLGWGKKMRGQWTNLVVCRGPVALQRMYLQTESTWQSRMLCLERLVPGDIIDLFVVLAGKIQLFPWELILTSGRGKRRCQPRQPSLWSRRQT